MSVRASELRQQRNTKLEQANAIHNAAESADRGQSEEERARFEGLIGEAQALEARAAECERVDGLMEGLERRGERRGDPLPHQDPANTRNGKHKYSVMKALRERLAMREGIAGARLTGLELEEHQELEKRSGRPAKGVRVPTDLAVGPMAHERRALTTVSGAGSIPTVLDPTMIDILRTRMVVRMAGARVMSDMQGLFAIPRQNQTATGNWVSEGSAPTGTNQTIDQVPFGPKTIGAFTDYSRRFVEQTNQDAEMFVREDLMAVVSRAVDLAALNGTGSSNQPLGILQNGAIANVSLGTNGAVPTYAALVSMETQIAVANADFGALSYIVNAKGRSTLKQTLKVAASTFPIYLWDTLPPENGVPKGMVNGYSAFVTNQLPSNIAKGSGTNLSPVIFGNFNDLIIAFWSGLDLLVDPYTGSSTGSVRVVCLQDADINVRHPESFSTINDMITS